jgi:hypothetical protein
MQVIEQIFLALLGFIFLRVAYKWMDKPDKLGQAFLFFLVAMCFFVCTLSGVQSLIKTNILWRFTKSLEEYGNKIDTFQTTVTDMRDDLKKQQSILASNQTTLSIIQSNIQAAQIGITNTQRGIANQFNEITYLQQQISAAQTNLYKQETLLANVQYWIENLYANMTFERVTNVDPTRVIMTQGTNGALNFLIMLKNAPITNSIEIYSLNSKGVDERFHILGNNCRNLIVVGTDNVDTNKLRFSLQYVADRRETNLFTAMPILNKDVWIEPDGHYYFRADALPENTIKK